MSQPLFFVDPETNEVKKVVEACTVTVAELDEQIAHHQNRISELNVEREKVSALTASVGSEQAPVDQPEAAAEEQTAAPADAAATPAEPQAAAEQPATDQPSTDAVATPPIAA